MTPLRIGLLGAARISDVAVVEPARAAGHRIVAVAARNPERARAWAAERGVERVVGGYAELVADPEVDVVYNPLPNSLHAPWTIAAIEAGKHVLAEKPFASNAAEARVVRDIVAGTDRVVFEAFHYRYHPIFERLLDIVVDGTIGELRGLQVTMSMPSPEPDDLRWSWDLAGGCLMDLGCYCVHAIRSVAERLGGVPTLRSASAGVRTGLVDVDEWNRLEFELPGGATATADATMNGPWDFHVTATGSAGSATIVNHLNVGLDNRIVIVDRSGERIERYDSRSTYSYQLDALAAAIGNGAPILTGPDDAVATMELIDECYRASGLPPRGMSYDTNRGTR